MVYCTKCGAESRQGETFCYNCGSRLVEGKKDQSQENSLPRSTIPSQPLTSAESTGVGSQYQQWGPIQPPIPKRRTNNGMKITFVLAVIIAAILISVAFSPGLIHFNTGLNSNSSSHSIQLNSGNYNVTYSWLYPYNSNREWTIKVTVPATTYNYYCDPAKTTDYASYVTKDDPIIDKIAVELKNDAKNNSFSTAQFVLSFVQNVPYGTDENTTSPPTDNFPRYPDETLVDGVGDCKDHSTLYVSLMESPAINVGMVLLELTKTGVSVGHMAAGIMATGYQGTYVQYGQNDYFYCETTSPGWTIGEMPPEMDGYTIQVLPA